MSRDYLDPRPILEHLGTMNQAWFVDCPLSDWYEIEGMLLASRTPYVAVKLKDVEAFTYRVICFAGGCPRGLVATRLDPVEAQRKALVWLRYRFRGEVLLSPGLTHLIPAPGRDRMVAGVRETV